MPAVRRMRTRTRTSRAADSGDEMIFSARQKRLVELLQGSSWNEADSLLLYGSCPFSIYRTSFPIS